MSHGKVGSHDEYQANYHQEKDLLEERFHVADERIQLMSSREDRGVKCRHLEVFGHRV